MTTYSPKRTTYRKALELARQLSLRDQRRLRAELAKLSSVRLVSPSRDPEVIHAARLRADEIRKTVQSATANQKFDNMMKRMQELNAKFSDEEVERDVEAAIQEVRAEKRAGKAAAQSKE